MHELITIIKVILPINIYNIFFKGSLLKFTRNLICKPNKRTINYFNKKKIIKTNLLL